MPATTLLSIHKHCSLDFSSSLFLFSSCATSSSTSSLSRSQKLLGEKYFQRFAFCSVELHFAALCCKLARSQQLSRSLTARVVRHTLMCFILSRSACLLLPFSDISSRAPLPGEKLLSKERMQKIYLSFFSSLCVLCISLRAWNCCSCWDKNNACWREKSSHYF